MEKANYLLYLNGDESEYFEPDISVICDPNKQEWRFGVSEGYKDITIAKPIGYKHPLWEHDDVDIAI